MPEPALARGIAQALGWQRTGARIQGRVAELLPLLDVTEENGVHFFWARGEITRRRPFLGLRGRPIREVSRTEIAWVEDLHAARVARDPDPVLELSRLLGIARLSTGARAYLETCRAWRAANPEPGPD